MRYIIKLVLILVLTCLLTNIVFADSFKETTAIHGGAKAYYPEKINVFEPFKVKIIFTDQELIENLEGISVTDCEIPFEIAIGLKESKLEFSGNMYKYNKKKEIDIWLSPTSDGGLDMIGIGDELKLSGCDLWLKGNNINNQNYIGLKYDYYPYSFGINNLPDGFILEKEDRRRGFFKVYKKEGGAEIRLLVNLERYRENGNFITFEDLKNYPPPGHSLSPVYPKEQLTINGKPALFWHKCGTSKNYQDEYLGECSMYASLLMPVGPVWFDMNAKQKQPVRSEADMLAIIDNWKSLFLDSLSNTYFESQGKNADFVIEGNDDYCGDCKQGYVCGACGECIKEVDAINPSEVELKLDPDIKNNNKKILNAIDSNIALTIYPKLDIMHNEDKVDYCKLKDPGLNMKISGKLTSNESFSGFTSGFPTDKREKQADCDVDLEESKPKCVFIISPSDKKKYFGDSIKDMIQEYEFKISVKDKILKKDAKIILSPPKKFELKLDSKGVQVHQGSNSVLEIKPIGGTTENIIVKATLMGPGAIGLTSKTISRQWIIDSIKEGSTIKLGYSAPALGNFDIGKELASLSMVDLQKKAVEQIAIDAATAYAGQYAQNIDELADLGMISKEAGHVAKEFKVINGIRSIKGVHDSIPGMTDEVGDASGVNEGKGEATWVEKSADVGVVGISAAQTAIGALTFIPNKIPYFGDITASWQTAFSAATNVWKANLQYVSKSEKINRAQELFYPTVILVTAQDISGWTTQKIHIYKIAYHEIK